MRKSKVQDKLEEHLAEQVAWSIGSDCPWEGYAMVSSEFMAALYALACYAPAKEIEKFIATSENNV
jgi:hypothetical protein